MRCLCLLLAALACTSLLRGADHDKSDFQQHALQQASTYRGTIGAADRKLTFLEKAVQRWTNPLQGRNARGDVFLWTEGGRPAALLSLYEYTDKAGVVHEHHEFASLAAEPVSVRAEGGVTWSPGVPGIAWEAVAGAPPPAEAPRQRLKQMRDIAGRVTAKKTTREGETRDLRLLTQPLYRYEGEENGKGGGWLDGALFAFVEHTDPEIVLLVEAGKAEKASVWRYAFARLNSIDLEASFDDKETWKASVLPWNQALNRKDLPYTAFTVK